ncbi:MAG: hypothetical protein ACMUIP_00830 [bacterium]
MKQKKTILCCIFLGIIFLFLAFNYIYALEELHPHQCLKPGCHYEENRHITQKCEECHPVSPDDDPNSCQPDNIYKITEFTSMNGIMVCYECHPKESLGVSHPVGVIPSSKISISKDGASFFPRASTGEILCISCHYSHNKKYDDLCRLPGSRYLCIECHGSNY